MIAIQPPKIKTGLFQFGGTNQLDAALLWQPNPDHEDGRPNPQKIAIKSEADEVFYGGAAGGGKTDLLLGLALTEHKKSVIFRRVNPNLQEIEDRLIEIVGTDENFNKSKKILRQDGIRLELESCQYEDDKKKQQGRPRDLYGFDEITEFSQTQYQFIIGWNRSTDSNQRCRVVVAGNPPIDEAGSWVIGAWGPWLDPTHSHRAEAGELRWYYYDDDNIVWLDNPEPVEIDGERVTPKSRTFIPAKLEDNPHLLHDDHYVSVLMSYPEPLRSIFRRGDFGAGAKADPWQVIPTAWVKLAQKRWLERQKPDMPCSGVGADIARGGADKLAVSRRYGTWFEKIKKVPGIDVEDGPAAAGLIMSELSNESQIGYINIDVIGVGASAFDSLKVIYPGKVIPVNAASKSEYEVKEKDEGIQSKVVLKMRNMRAEYHWRLREALDPIHGDGLALPPGNEIVADLCAARWKLMAGGVVQIENKEDIKQRLGRSPDVGEAIMLAHLPEYSPWLEIDFLKV